MAASPPPMKLELPPTPVQELIKTVVKQIPERYIHKVANKPSDQSENKYMDSPLIDFSLLSASSSSNHDELHKLRTTLSSWGCFQLINHGLSSSLLNQIREVQKEFFALPIEVKQKYARTLDWIEGYGNDTVTEDQSYMWNDRLLLKVYPMEQRNFKFWPEELPKFRETLVEYSKNVRRVLEMILKAIAKSINIEENRIYRECEGEEGIYMLARFNYYPPCSFPDLVYGLKPHSDTSAVTFLLQDKEVEGLQVQKDNVWYKVPIVPDALFINVGDQLERYIYQWSKLKYIHSRYPHALHRCKLYYKPVEMWNATNIMSNGLLKSAVHTIVVDNERERTSVAIACSPHPEKEIGPFSELIYKEGRQRYKKVKNYVKVYLQYSPTAERAINAMKL